MSGALIVLCGPPLPGRWALARALGRRLGAVRFPADGRPATRQAIAAALTAGRAVLVDGDLATTPERAALLQLQSAERVLVEWMCPRKEAEREIFHRYASRPRSLAELEMARYLADAARRTPVEVPRDRTALVQVGALMPLGDQVLAVVSQLGPRPPVAPMPQRATVLVVEDEADERELLAEILDELGYCVERAPDASVALALVESGGIDVVLSDQRMPGMSGVELVKALCISHPEVRSVLLTAYGDHSTVTGAVNARAVTVLSKPVRVVDLERVLEEAGAAR
jgi:CheY-like chemotaxis protein/predicted kinase